MPATLAGMRTLTAAQMLGLEPMPADATPRNAFIWPEMDRAAFNCFTPGDRRLSIINTPGALATRAAALAHMQEVWIRAHAKAALRAEEKLDDGHLTVGDVVSLFNITGNRAWGAPRQTAEISGPDGAPLQTTAPTLNVTIKRE